MTNEFLWLSFLLANIFYLLIAFAWFGRYGLAAVVIINTILCNLQVLKIIKLFGLTVTLGNILYSSIFLATDLLSEFYGKKAARQAVNLGLLGLFSFTVVMQFTLLFTPESNDLHHQAMTQIFYLTPRITLASLIAYACSQYHDIWLFHWVKNKTQGKYLWLRKNVSTLASQILDTAIFNSIAFYGVYSPDLLLTLIGTTLLIKSTLCFLETPVIYLAKSIYKNKLQFEN